jgi:tetratricopeptide (TPR) repeat protein
MSIRAMRIVLCLLAIIATQVVAGEATWKTATTANYRLISQLDDRDTTSWMREFDQYILSTSEVLKINLSAMPPLTVVIFARDKDYEPYKLLKPNGRTASVAGQFVRQPTWSLIGMAYGSMNEDTRRTIYHEATHWLMSGDQSRQPAWFSEGVAEMFSTFERRGDKVNWAKPIGAHMQVLNQLGNMPMNVFLTTPGAIFDRDDHTTIFYAQAWAFTHFMLFSKNPERRQQLTKFLELYRTESGEATMNAVFGADIKPLEKEFHVYAGQRSWGYMIEPLKAAAPPPAPQPAAPALVESSLGYLALGAERYELAQRHADNSLALDANAPEAHGLLAYLALEKKDFDKAATHAEAAVQQGSKDSNLLVLLGNAYDRGPLSNRPHAVATRINLYEKAINLSPRQLPIYERLTEAIVSYDKPREEEGKFLELGLRVFPGADWLRVGTAVVNYKTGHRETAVATMDSVLRPESTLDASQRDYAAGLKRSWLVEDMNSEINSAIDKNDVAGARTVVARYRTTLGNDADITKFLDEVDSGLQLRELGEQFERALRAHKMTEARALASQLLALPNLPARMRDYLQQQGLAHN